MQYFESFASLLKNYKELHYPGRIYMQGAEWNNLTGSQFWVLSSGEAKEQELVSTEYGDIPESLVSYQVTSLLDTGTFQDIIGGHHDLRPENGLDDTAGFSNAVTYYLEHDDFMD